MARGNLPLPMFLKNGKGGFSTPHQFFAYIFLSFTFFEKVVSEKCSGLNSPQNTFNSHTEHTLKNINGYI